jgi:SAM-dependent methyltransferase
MFKKPLSEPWVPLGAAMMDYFLGNIPAVVCIKSTIESDRAVPIETFFRTIEGFPALEKSAFRYCTGKILDAGAGAGPHALYLQEKGFDVTAIDISDQAVEVMRKRGIRKVFCTDVLQFENEKFDTILMMMNGIGVAGDLHTLKDLLNHFKSLLAPNGRIIFDSTDIAYVTSFDRASGSIRIPMPEYYGTVYYQLEYKGEMGTVYPWLYIDRKTMKRICEETGYTCRILKNKRSQYLAQLTVNW